MSSCKYMSADHKAFCIYIHGECQFLSGFVPSDDFTPIDQTSIKVIYDYVVKLNRISEALVEVYSDFSASTIDSNGKTAVQLIQDIFSALNNILDFIRSSVSSNRFTTKTLSILKYYFKAKNGETSIEDILDDYKIQIQDDDAKFKVLADAVEKVYGFSLTIQQLSGDPEGEVTFGNKWCPFFNEKPAPDPTKKNNS